MRIEDDMASVGPKPTPPIKKVFVISPIGGADTPIRIHANRFLNYIVKVALAEPEYIVSRADDDDSPYAITEAMLRAILEADICVADITGLNPNVMYELALAHAAGKRVVIMTSSTESRPFDIKDMRAIEYGIMPEEVHEAVLQLRQKATHENGPSAFSEMLNPVASAFAKLMDEKRIEAEGGTSAQALGRVVERFEEKLDRALRKEKPSPERISATGHGYHISSPLESESVLSEAMSLSLVMRQMIRQSLIPRQADFFLEQGEQFMKSVELGKNGAEDNLLSWIADMRERIESSDKHTAWSLG